ncbi:MAG: hypothetical protein JL56_12930 [Desulfotomaculum sp. BICA1-6]|nr:MAG: hypothetical protein VR67_08945 [Peptococcaceae bacterium BRH_c8a]KJS72432.1 MAG: hypothetical protein JL56_12930 [Desulfotomaculum sp. BICA1-6]
MVYLLTLIFLGIIAFEVPGLVRKKMWRELAAFSVLLVIGMIYSYGQVLDIPLPNPTKGIEAVFKPVSQYLDQVLS